MITNLQLNEKDGFRALKIDGLPAGDYAVSTSMGQGGATSYKYTATFDGEATEANDSGYNEIMTLTFTTDNGRNASFSFDLGMDMDSKEKVASLVVDKINEKSSITIDGKAVTLSATLNEDGTSYSIKATGSPHVVRMRSNVAVSTVTKAAVTNTTDCDTVPYRIFKVPQQATVNATVNISYGSRTGSVTVTRGQTQAQIAENVRAQLASMGINGATISPYYDSRYSGSYEVLIGKSSDTPNLDMTVTTRGAESWATPGLDEESSPENYRINAGCTITHGNDSDAQETITVTFSDGVNTNAVEIEIPGGTDAASIPAIISDKLNSSLSNKLTWGGKTINFKVNDNGNGSFTIASVNRNTDVWNSKIYVSIEGPKSVQAKGAAQADEVVDELITIPLSEADAIATLTGTYGIDADDALTLGLEGASGKPEHNASILFTVTNSYYDEESGMGTVMLSAISHTLGTDGEADTITEHNIILSTKHEAVNLGRLLGEDDDRLTLSLKDTFDVSRFQSGQKFVYNICGVGDPMSSPADTSLFITGLQDSTWPYNWEDGGYITKNNEKIQYNLNAEAASNRDIHFRNFYLNSDNGHVYDGDMLMTLTPDFAEAAKNFTAEPETAAAFTANYIGKIALGDTKLRDLEPFWNSSGVFMLEQPQVITISQNDGKRTQVTLRGSDTLNDVRQKLNDAIAEGLGQGLYVQGGDANKIVTFVETPDDGTGLETVKGTFMIRSLIPGSAGELTFSSDYAGLIDAIGLNTVKDSQESSYTVSVFNAHDNSVVARNVKTSGNLLEGIVDKNVDIEFNPMSGVNAVWNEVEKNFVLVPENDSYETTVHVVKNNVTFQTGTNEGEEVTLDIGNMSSGALGISRVNVMTHERAANAITIIDSAIKRVSSQRSKLGTYQNALEHLMETLTVTNENMAGAESRIKDADMSKSLMDLVKFRIINQSSTSMLAQANQLSQSVMNLMQ